MSYIPYSFAPMGKDGEKEFSFAVPSGGVSFKKGEDAQKKCAVLSNFDIYHDGISTRKNLSPIVHSFEQKGDFHGAAKATFNDRVFFHVGTYLLSHTDGEGEFLVVSDSLPDKDSVFCIFMSKLYIFCDCRIFCVDNEFVFSEQMPDAPVIFENANPVTCFGMEETYTCYNLIAPRVTVAYSDRPASTNMSGTTIYELPRRVDRSKTVNVYINDKEVKAKYITVEEKHVHIHRDANLPDNPAVKVSFFIAEGEETSFENMLGGCRLAVSFGGNTSGGTRIFLTGNSDKKGYYFKSALQNPLYFPMDEGEIIGDGCENITSVIRMYGNLIIFTEKSVFKMTHNITSSSSYYSVKELSCEAGCDCPDSVQLIDNRVVFANSQKGVFIIDSTNDMGEHNIKPLSGNINRGEGKGLLDLSKEHLKNCSSVDFDRKYMLFADGRVYIWDYNRTPFYDAGNYSTAQERLCWYIYEDVCEGIGYETADGLLMLDKENISLYRFESAMEQGSVGFRVKSHGESFGAPSKAKCITEMEIILCTEGSSEANLLLYADEICCFEKKLYARNDRKNHFIISCPVKKFYNFSFEIVGKGNVKIENIITKFRYL